MFTEAKLKQWNGTQLLIQVNVAGHKTVWTGPSKFVLCNWSYFCSQFSLHHPQPAVWRLASSLQLPRTSVSPPTWAALEIKQRNEVSNKEETGLFILFKAVAAQYSEEVLSTVPIKISSVCLSVDRFFIILSHWSKNHRKKIIACSNGKAEKHMLLS